MSRNNNFNNEFNDEFNNILPTKSRCSRGRNLLPNNIGDLLESLIGKVVVIILNSGRCQVVRIRAVVGDVVVADFLNISSPFNIKFINIECICEVITRCPDLLESFLD